MQCLVTNRHFVTYYLLALIMQRTRA